MGEQQFIGPLLLVILLILFAIYLVLRPYVAIIVEVSLLCMVILSVGLAVRGVLLFFERRRIAQMVKMSFREEERMEEPQSMLYSYEEEPF